MYRLRNALHAGKALYVGISRWPLNALEFADKYLRERDVPLLIYQGRLNLLDREPQDDGVLKYCHEHGIGFISFSPLAQGLLTERYQNGIPSDSRMAKGKFLRPEMLTPELQACLRQYDIDAASQGKSISEYALSWILEQEGVTSILVGVSSVGQLEQNLRSVCDAI